MSQNNEVSIHRLDYSRNWAESAAEPRFHLDFRKGLLGQPMLPMYEIFAI
jgi:hypothetical protein